MGVKSFFADDEAKIANKINEWLGDKPQIVVVDIKFNTVYINRPEAEDSGVMIFAWVLFK